MQDGIAEELDTAIRNCRMEHMIPMVELQDASIVPTLTDLQVTYYNSNLSETTNSLVPRFKITNTGTEAIDLSNVKGTFIAMDEVTETADCYLEISFLETAGSIAPNAVVDIQCRVAKLDWSNYSQANDYSFNGNSSDYEIGDKIVVYYNDSIVLGIEL